MTDRGIILRPLFILGARSGTRTHIFMPGTFLPNQRTAVGTEARQRQANQAAPAMRLPTPWSRLEVGDRLFVQEEIACLIDTRHNEIAETFYKMELPGGHVPIPGGVRAGRWTTRTDDARKCDRSFSRYTLEITAVRNCRARETTWAEVKAEGTHDPHQSLNAWWGRNYGLQMPWEENPQAVGLHFKFTDGNIDTGQRWEKAEAPKSQGGGPDYIRKMYGTRPVND